MCMTLIHSEDGLGWSDYNICVFVVRFTCIYVYINLHLYTGIVVKVSKRKILPILRTV